MEPTQTKELQKETLFPITRQNQSKTESGIQLSLEELRAELEEIETYYSQNTKKLSHSKKVSLNRHMGSLLAAILYKKHRIFILNQNN
jgi:hypothetical protein